MIYIGFFYFIYANVYKILRDSAYRLPALGRRSVHRAMCTRAGLPLVWPLFPEQKTDQSGNTLKGFVVYLAVPVNSGSVLSLSL